MTVLKRGSVALSETETISANIYIEAATAMTETGYFYNDIQAWGDIRTGVWRG